MLPIVLLIVGIILLAMKVDGFVGYLYKAIGAFLAIGFVVWLVTSPRTLSVGAPSVASPLPCVARPTLSPHLTAMSICPSFAALFLSAEFYC